MRSERKKSRRMQSKGLGEGGFSLKNTLYITGTILALGVIAFFVTVMIYNNNINKVYEDLETQSIGKVNTSQEASENKIEEASADLGKTVNEVEKEQETKETKETTAENEEEKGTIAINTSKQEKEQKDDSAKKENDKKETEEKKGNESKQEIEKQTEKEEEAKKEVKKKLEFSYPVEGEIQKEYAKDKLVYSETLKEWVTHTGIDIKAEKTTVVKSAEEGTVTAIKNDPRFGTTVIVEHQDGYETRYANLLTAEFVNIGEKITKGQTIGTVGNTGAFEVLDDYHLHFEVLKDGEYLDPTLFIK